MATGLDRLLFILTTTLIVARILAISNANRSPRQRIHGRRSRIILGNDLLYPRIVSEKIRHYANRRYYKYLPNQNTTTYTSIIKIILLYLKLCFSVFYIYIYPSFYDIFNISLRSWSLIHIYSRIYLVNHVCH